MAGTAEGAAKARAKALAKDPDVFKKASAKANKKGTRGGFNVPGVASRAGKIGGKASPKKKVGNDGNDT